MSLHKPLEPFKNMPYNVETIKNLQAYFEKAEEKAASEEIVAVLKSTNSFFSQTASSQQKNRDLHITNEKILNLLNTLEKALKNFHDQFGNAPSNSNPAQALDYCKNAIESRITEMRGRKDKIADYYDNNNNNLKTFLESNKKSHSLKA